MARLSRRLFLQEQFVTLWSRRSVDFPYPHLFCLKIKIAWKIKPLDLKTIWVWAPSLSLAATREITTLSFFLRLLSCFSSPSSLCITYDLVNKAFSNEWPTFKRGQVSPFGNPRVITLLNSSSRLKAVLHFLHRHEYPRHPPHALIT